MKKTLIFTTSFLGLALLSTAAWGRLSDGKSHVKAKGNKVYCSVDKGFHFNKEAPASLQSEDGRIQRSPSKKEEVEIVFDAAQMDKKTFTLSFYVCDDQKTVCEPQEQTFKKEGDQLFVTSSKNGNTATTSVETNEKPPKASAPSGLKNEHGFLMNDFSTALRQAGHERKMVLVDFGAPWCPACIRLETETFGKADFKKATQKLVKLSMNIDLVQNKALADKYAIKAIPTLILMDSEGNEIYRILDFKPSGALAKELGQALSGPLITYDSLKLEAEAGNQKAMAALGLKAFNSMDFSTALRWLSPLKSEQLLLANAEISFWNEKVEGDAQAKKDYINILEKWITLFPETFDAVVWRNEWVGQVKKEGKELSGEARALLSANVRQLKNALVSAQTARKFVEKTYQGDFSGFEVPELNYQLSETYGLLGEKAKKEMVDQAMVNAIKKIKLSSSRPGEVITALHYLNKAGMKKEVVAWNEKLIQAYPNSYVYYMRLARFYMAEKDFARALPLAKRGVELGPELALQNMQVLAKIQAALNQKEEAKETVAKALSLPEAKLESYKNQTTALLELQKTL